MPRPQSRVVCLLLLAVVGCAPSPPVADTGSRATVQTYFEALVRRDWPNAYAALHPESRKGWTLDQFTRAAQTHRKALGFEPEEIHVSSCEEHGTEATAHVLLSGHTSKKLLNYKDAVTLKRADTGWGIVVPASFGK